MFVSVKIFYTCCLFDASRAMGSIVKPLLVIEKGTHGINIALISMLMKRPPLVLIKQPGCQGVALFSSMPVSIDCDGFMEGGLIGIQGKMALLGAYFPLRILEMIDRVKKPRNTFFIIKNRRMYCRGNPDITRVFSSYQEPGKSI